MKTFTTHIDGIVCQCRVTHYLPYVPAKVSGPPEDCYPGEASEFEFRILDLDGNYDPVLQDMVTDDDEVRLQDEYEAWITANKHGEDF